MSKKGMLTQHSTRYLVVTFVDLSHFADEVSFMIGASEGEPVCNPRAEY